MNISVDKLALRCNPFKSNCWIGLDSPVTIEEIQSCIDVNDLLAPDLYRVRDDWEDRVDHIRLIAWFVKNGWVDPIGVDVGIPSLACHVGWPVQDGNHRFAAAIFRGDSIIDANMQGATEEILCLAKMRDDLQCRLRNLCDKVVAENLLKHWSEDKSEIISNSEICTIVDVDRMPWPESRTESFLDWTEQIENSPTDTA